IAQAQALRREHPALAQGVPAVLNADARTLSLVRYAPTERARIDVGPQVRITFERGDFRAEGERARRQWLTRGGRRRMAVPGAGGAVVVGSGPELGAWKLDKALPLPAQADLPVGGVFELKVVSRGQWEPGPNRVLFVGDGPGPLEVSLAPRGT